jgi:hypothetical protein
VICRTFSAFSAQWKYIQERKSEGKIEKRWRSIHRLFAIMAGRCRGATSLARYHQSGFPHFPHTVAGDRRHGAEFSLRAEEQFAAETLVP